MCFPASSPRLLGLKASLFASLALLTSGALYAQNSDSSDVTALKTQMEKMQKQYEDRISAMESKMQSLESKAESGTILNTHVLTDADGKQYEGKGGVALDESFLKSLTRNFSFTAYVRAGVQFNGSGGGGNFNFEVPDNDGGRARLGNENDTYFELTWKQAHMLGDSPDVMDVSMVFTPAFRYVQNRASFVGGVFGSARQNGDDFDIVWREAYLEMANVFKGAPEITFWGGQRFYDRFNFDPQDYFYLDMSGYGAGVKNIDVGIGKLWLAYLGGLDDDIAAPTSGSFYKHSLDARLKDIQIGPGKLMLVGIANYEKGNTFTHNFAGATLTNPVRTQDAYGLGGGAVYKIDLSAIGPKSYLELFALAGFGATNFSTSTDLGVITGFRDNFLVINPTTPAGVTIDAGSAIQRTRTYRAGGIFVWNPNPCFSLGVWGIWNQDSGGFRLVESFPNPVFPGATVFKNAPATRNLYTVGIRPIVWITDNIAIQGEAGWNYVDNVRGWQTNGYPAFGGSNGLPVPRPGTLSPTAFSRSGNFLKFTIAPTIKPKGGYYTRPELRVFATYSIWSTSLRGATTPIQEGGNTGGWTPSPYANGKAQDGWLIGTQVEWYL
jgi:maltoporin